jgi:hypothetical protein
MNLYIEKFDNDIVRSTNSGLHNATIVVNGNKITPFGSRWEWSISGDLDTGESETASTLYYLYIKDTGSVVVSTVSPRPADWRLGEYHPHKPWRCVGLAYNNASSNVEGAGQLGLNDELRMITPNGRGSTNTARLRWSTVDFQNGGSISQTDSSTNGFIATIHRTGRYAITYRGPKQDVQDEFTFGITINGYSGTVACLYFQDDILASVYNDGPSATSTLNDTVTWAGILYQGDRIYSQYDNSADPEYADGIFDIQKLGDLYNNGAPIMNAEEN